MIYKLEKALPEGMKITKKGETAPLKYYSNVVSSRLAIAAHPVIRGGYDTGLDETKQKYFEEAIGLEEGTLAIKSPWWMDFGIMVLAGGTMLNEVNPEDELKIFQLKRRKDVAHSKLETKTKSGIKWLLTSEESEAEIETNRRDYLVNALSTFAAMTPNEMRTYLESQKTDTSNMSDIVVKKKVGDEAEKHPKKFLLISNDSRKADKIFINELVKYSIVKQANGKYINEDKAIIAYDDNDMLVYLADKNNTQQVAIWKKMLTSAKKKS
jgi:hypothetical protein